MGSRKVNGTHVGMLVHSYYPEDVRVRREAEALAEAGYEVDVVCLRKGNLIGGQREARRETLNRVQVHRLPLTRRRGGTSRYTYEYLAGTLLGAWKLAVLHLKNRFRVVHIHNMPDFLVLAGWIPKLSGAKLVLDIHDPMGELYSSTRDVGPNHWIVKILKWQEKLCCWFADKIISVNETMRENLERKGVPPEKVSIVHNFSDGRYLPVITGEVRWPRHSDSFVLLYTGTVTNHYKLNVAVEAVGLALRECACLKLRILGDGNQVGEALELARRLGIESNIEHIRPVPFDAVGAIMKEADVGISTHQGGIFGDLYFATKVMDYLTQGLPVICSRTKTMTRYLPEDALFYFEPENPKDMARQILRTWREPLLVKSKLTNAQSLIRRYSWDDEKRKLQEVYVELLTH